MQLELEVHHEDSEPLLISVDQFPVTLGRHADCEVRLNEKHVSRRHARLEVQGAGIAIVDLGSGNGIEVNGLRSPDCRLHKGDVISIGSFQIHVLKTSTPRREQRMEQAEQRLLKTRRTATAGPILIALAVVVCIAVWIATRDPSTGSVTQPTLSDTKQAELELTKFRRYCSDLERIDPAVLDQADALATKWRGLYIGENKQPFRDLTAKLRNRRRLELSSDLFELEREVASLVQESKFETASLRLDAVKFQLTPSESDLLKVITRLRRSIESALHRKLLNLQDEIDYLARFEEFDRCFEVCRKSAPLFVGTSKAKEFEEVVGLVKKEMERAHENRRKLRESLREATQDSAAKTVAETAEPEEQPTLARFLTKPISSGKLAKGKYTLGDQTGAPVAIDEELRVTVRTRQGGTEYIDFAQIKIADQLQMAIDGVRGKALFEIAQFAFAENYSKQADQLLAAYASGDADSQGKRQLEIDGLLARVRGLRSPPSGGFSYSKKFGWEDARQKTSRDVVQKASSSLSSLEKVRSVANLESKLEKLNAHLENPALTTMARSEIRGLVIASLENLRTKQISKLTKLAEHKRFALLREAKIELVKRRKAALAVIFDRKVYLPENDPRWRDGDKVNGQAKVDEVVGQVRELWDSSAEHALSLGKSSREALDIVRAIDGKHFPALRHRIDSASQEVLSELLVNLDEQIDLKRYASNQAELDAYLYNREIEKFNRELQSDDVADTDKAHVAVVNDYREMMGLRRLFIVPQLCVATRKHSADQNAAGRIWHNGPNGTPATRAKAAGYSGGVAENVAIGYGNPKDIWTVGWYRASDHHRNGLGAGHTCMGYGYVGRVGSQNFGSQKAPAD